MLYLRKNKPRPIIIDKAMKKIALVLLLISLFVLNARSQSVSRCGLDCKGFLEIVDVYWTGPDQEYIVEFDLPASDPFQEPLRVTHLTGCGSPLVLSVDASGHCTVLIQMPEQLVRFGRGPETHFTWDWELVTNYRESYTNCEYHYHITVNAVNLIP